MLGFRQALVLVSVAFLAVAARAQVIAGTNIPSVNIQCFNLSTSSYAAPISQGSISIKAMAADDLLRIIYISSGPNLYQVSYDPPRTIQLIAAFSGATTAINGGLGWDSHRGKLYATSFGDALISQTLYEVDPHTAVTTAIRTIANADMGGLDYDPTTDLLYFCSDTAGATGGGLNGRGIYTIAYPYDTSPVVKIAGYPNKTTGSVETDIDGLAVGNGRVYLITDETNWMYIYNLTTGLYETPVAQTPFGSDRGSSGATFAPGFFIGPTYDVAAQLTAPPDCSISIGGQAVFHIAASNPGPRTVTNVRAAFTLPAGCALVSSTPTGTLIGNTLTIQLGTLAPAASVPADVTLVPSAPGINTASVTVSCTETDANPANNTASASTRIAPAPPTSAAITGIISTIATNSSSLLADAPGLHLTGTFGRPYACANGAYWIMKASLSSGNSANDEAILIGDSAGVHLAAREGLSPPIPGPQGPLAPIALSSILAINDSQSWAFSGNDGRSGGGVGGNFVARATGFGAAAAVTVIAREGNSVPHLSGITYSQPRGGLSLSNFDDVAFASTLSGSGVTAANNMALFSSGGLLARTDISVPTGQSSGGTPSFFSLKSIDWDSSATGFSMNALGDQYCLAGAINASTTTPPPGGIDRVAMRSDPERGNPVVWVQENTLVPAIGPGFTAADTAPFSYSYMEPSGAWMFIGALNGGGKWAMRDGAVIARSGDPIMPGSSEHWSTARDAACFVAACDDGLSHYVVVGATDSADPLRDTIVLFDGELILARENDPVDLDHNGIFDDGAYIASFVPAGAFLAPDGFFAVVNLRGLAAAGACAVDAVIGQALVQIMRPAPSQPCPADFNQDGGIDGQDVQAFFVDWEAGAADADVNQDGGIDGQDVETFFRFWEAGGC